MADAPVSLLPQMQGWQFPAPAADGVSDEEQALIRGLSARLGLQTYHMRIARSYYEGTQRLANLGVSIPPQLAAVRVIVDWPRIVVDPLVQRANVAGFRLPGATEFDTELAEHWQANSMDAEAPLCFLDSLVCGRGYIVVGSPDRAGDSPLITVESPMNMAVQWDPRSRSVRAAYQAYEAEGQYYAALYLPDQTITMARQDLSEESWAVVDRDQHAFGEVPVVRLPNRPRSDNREGMSEISPAIMNTTDSACRSLLAMEIAREFYAIPHRYILGASESDFQNADGTKKTAIDMVMSKFLAFEPGEDGANPVVGQFQAFDPSVFTKIIDKHAQLMASYTQFPPQWFGQDSTANPASADAIRVAQDGVNRRGRQVQNQWSDPLEDVMRLVWRFANNGQEIPADFMQMETNWEPVETRTPSADTDAAFKQVQMGAVPASSDVLLERLGYSFTERERLKIDRQADAAEQALAELAVSLQAKEARVDNSVATLTNPQAARGTPAPAPKTGADGGNAAGTQ